MAKEPKSADLPDFLSIKFKYMATIVVFASSLSIALIFILIKAAEIRSGKKNIVLRLIGKLDAAALKLVADAKFRGLQLTQSIRYIVLVQSKIVCLDLLYKVQNKILSEYQKRQSVMMGHKDIINKGSVSFYLKKIAEDKGNGRKGKINDGI